jgi:hypothetical protein
MNSEDTITLTIGEVAVTGTRMYQLGTKQSGLTNRNIIKIKNRFESLGSECKIINIAKKVTGHKPVYVLVVKSGVNTLLKDTIYTSDHLYLEQKTLTPDTKKIMWGSIKNCHARYNLIFGKTHSDQDLVNKKCGTVIAFNEVPLFKYIKERISELIKTKYYLYAEGNYYYNKNCGISYHGDAERNIVIGIRLGRTIPLYYRWYKYGKKTNKVSKVKVNHGDIYFMSERAVGGNWKKGKTIKWTVRHAAGANKYIK